MGQLGWAEGLRQHLEGGGKKIETALGENVCHARFSHA